jgi:hypothetical protein
MKMSQKENDVERNGDRQRERGKWVRKRKMLREEEIKKRVKQID